MHKKINIKSIYFTLLKSTSFITLKFFFTPKYALSIDIEDGLCLSKKQNH